MRQELGLAQERNWKLEEPGDPIGEEGLALRNERCFSVGVPESGISTGNSRLLYSWGKAVLQAGLGGLVPSLREPLAEGIGE